MCSQMTRRCLFGGTLFAAGLVQGALGAPMMGFGDGYSSGTIDADGPSGGYYLMYGGPGPSPFADGSYTGGGLTASFDASRTQLAITQERHTSDTWTSSRVEIVAYFTVNEPCLGRVIWDFGGWEGPNQAQLFNFDTLTSLVQTFGNPVGNKTAALEPNVQYGIFLVCQGEAPGGSSMASFGVEPLEGCNDADINKDGVLNLDDIAAFADAFIFGCG
ncbi:MAG: hypothetical protein R3B49_11955 [Phycisphaerales bacterium]